jgi:hypothetical protein
MSRRLRHRLSALDAGQMFCRVAVDRSAVRAMIIQAVSGSGVQLKPLARLTPTHPRTLRCVLRCQPPCATMRRHRSQWVCWVRWVLKCPLPRTLPVAIDRRARPAKSVDCQQKGVWDEAMVPSPGRGCGIRLRTDVNDGTHDQFCGLGPAVLPCRLVLGQLHEIVPTRTRTHCDRVR